VYDVARSSRRLALKKDIKIEVQIAQESYPLEGDYGRLRQMLLVFVDNALKFSPEHGSVTISLQDKRLEVTDHGSGVEAKDLPHIFERFYKSRMENNKTGTGLGLAIAREIAERHRMRVHMESEPGVATKVVVELP
jgi:signal transduction histidine kinase